MDKDLTDGARELFADELFETVRRCYCEANKDYLDKQMKIASEYMTDEQKEELRQRGITVDYRSELPRNTEGDVTLCEKCQKEA